MARVKVGEVFYCGDEDGCGIEVEVRKVCGCVDECDLICCGKQMKRRVGPCCSQDTGRES